MLGLFGKERFQNKVMMIRVELIRPNPAQPRRFFDEEELMALSRSIQQNGLLQPLTVRRLGPDRYELIAGERRLRAAKLAHCRAVPCLVVSVSEEQSAVFALLENIQRQDLSFFEQARGILTLMETWGLTQESAAARLGMAQSTLANKLRLLKLSRAVQDKVTEAGLTERHARALLKLEREETQLAVIGEIRRSQLNVSQTEAYVKKILLKEREERAAKPHRGETVRVVKDVRIFYNTITHAVDLMRRSGIPAVAQKRETGEFIEFLLQIPKAAAQENHKQEAPQQESQEPSAAPKELPPPSQPIVSQPETA